jgi:hypothetical protein
MVNYFEANIMELRDWGGGGWKEIYGDLLENGFLVILENSHLLLTF